MDKENFRCCIKVRTALNIPASAIYDKLYSVHGNRTCSYGIVRRWVQWFCEGREEIEDEARPSRSVLEQYQKMQNRFAFLLMMILILQKKRCKRKLVIAA